MAASTAFTAVQLSHGQLQTVSWHSPDFGCHQQLLEAEGNKGSRKGENLARGRPAVAFEHPVVREHQTLGNAAHESKVCNVQSSLTVGPSGRPAGVPCN